MEKSNYILSLELKEREINIIKLIAEGHSNQEIAKRLFLSPHTIKANVEQMYDKIGLHNRIQVAIWAIRNNIID